MLKDWTLLRELPGEPRIRLDEPLSGYCTFQVGGPADCVVFPSRVKDVSGILRFVAERELPLLVLGRGSNVLPGDSGFRGLVMVMGSSLGRLSFEGHRVTAEAGVPLPRISKRTGEVGLKGFEFAAGIPGSVGGGVRMNAGTKDGAIEEVVSEVIAVRRDGSIRTYRAGDLGFDYRSSVFQRNGEIVVGAEFTLEEDDPEAVQKRIRESLDYRTATQPLAVPSAGSVFRNPPGDTAGRLIDRAGCKGDRIGGAEVSTLHANWIVNRGGASATDIWSLIRRIQGRVENAFGVKLVPEVELVGEGFEDPA